jgi:hypothetical protein
MCPGSWQTKNWELQIDGKIDRWVITRQVCYFNLHHQSTNLFNIFDERKGLPLEDEGYVLLNQQTSARVESSHL